MSAELIESTERAPGLPRAIDSDRCERECDAALLPLLPLLPGAWPDSAAACQSVLLLGDNSPEAHMQLEFPHDIRYAALKLAILNTPGGCSNCHVEDAMAYVQFLDQENGEDDYDEKDMPRVPAPKDGSMKPLSHDPNAA